MKMISNPKYMQQYNENIKITAFCKEALSWKTEDCRKRGNNLWHKSLDLLESHPMKIFGDNNFILSETRCKNVTEL